MEDENFVVPCTAGFEFITPAIAKGLLSTGNSRNRDLIVPSVRRISGIIDREEWMYDSTDAVGLTEDGTLVNGQHRLSAIIESGKGVWMLVVRGVRPSVVQIIDQGMSRTLVQTLHIQGGYSDAGATATAVEWIYRMINRYERHMPSENKPTVPQKLQLLDEHTHLVDSMEPAQLVQRKVGTLVKGVWTAYHYAFACADPELADEFFQKLATGLEMTADEPVHTLREKLDANRKEIREKQLKTWHAAALVVQAWEAQRQNKRLSSRQLKVVSSGKNAQGVPLITDVDWLIPELSEE